MIHIVPTEAKCRAVTTERTTVNQLINKLIIVTAFASACTPIAK